MFAELSAVYETICELSTTITILITPANITVKINVMFKCSIKITLFGLKSNHDGVQTSVTIHQQSSPLTDLFKNLSSFTAEIAPSCVCDSLRKCFIACEPADGEVSM